MTESSQSDSRVGKPAQSQTTELERTCPPWCTDHHGDPAEAYDQWGDSWHQSSPVEISGTKLQLSSGTLDGSPRVFGLWEITGDEDAESHSLETCEQLAVTLLGLVAAARRGADRSMGAKA